MRGFWSLGGLLELTMGVVGTRLVGFVAGFEELCGVVSNLLSAGVILAGENCWIAFWVECLTACMYEKIG
jgi:hypothetical protein